MGEAAPALPSDEPELMGKPAAPVPDEAGKYKHGRKGITEAAKPRHRREGRHLMGKLVIDQGLLGE
jgi:hypothetical protein